MFSQTYQDQYGRGKIVEGTESFVCEKLDGVKNLKKIDRFESSSYYIGYT